MNYSQIRDKTLYQPDEHTTCRNLRIKMREEDREKKRIFGLESVAADQQKQQRENRRTFAAAAKQHRFVS